MSPLRYLIIGISLLVWTLPARAVPIVDLPNLDSITVFEHSGPGPDLYVR